MILCTNAYYGNNWGMKIRTFEPKVRFNMVRYKWALLYINYKTSVKYIPVV